MDRERLQQVQQSDLSESRINEDFVNWIKTSGLWYLLAVLVGIAVYLYLVNLQRAELQAREQGWFEFQDAQMPSSLEDVAVRHAEIDGLATLARLKAANTHLRSIQTNLAVGASIEDGTPLSAEDRETSLQRAEQLYRQVVDLDDGTSGATIATVTALNGLAAIAESQGRIDEAKTFFERAATRAADDFPPLADIARQRAANTYLFAEDVELPLAAARTPPGGTSLTATPDAATPLDVDNILNLPSPASEPATPNDTESDGDGS